ncbi:MAG TPA: NIL domain-containing protein [Coleofasciculaceae cyanobacterium]
MTTHPSPSHNVEKQLTEVPPITASHNCVETNPPAGTRLRIRVPKKYSDEPIISRLISDYGVTVNIAAALLGANARDDGWFDLELHGNPDQIQEAVRYLNKMDVEIWGVNTEDDTW